MLQSSNYVTKRQSLRLLEDILIDRHNFQIMCVRASPFAVPLSCHPCFFPIPMNAWMDAWPWLVLCSFHPE